MITPKKPTPKMKSLVQLTVEEAKRSVPSDVIRVALASFDFAVKLPLWLDKCPLQMSYLLPVENTSFDVFSYPEYSKTRHQIEPRIIDPSHVLTNMQLRKEF